MGHLRDVNMSYWQHFALSLSFSRRLGLAAFVALLHAIYPNAHTTYTTKTVRALALDLHQTRSGPSARL